MNKIPKIIHQIYFPGEAALPENYSRYRQTVLDLHPDWEYYFWDEQKCRKFLEDNYPWFLEVYDSYPSKFIQRCDSIRYFLLYHYGGFYIDLDIEFLKPLDDLLEDYELILSKIVGFSNAIMGSVPKHPLWPKVFEELDKRKLGIRRKFDPLFLFRNIQEYSVCYSTGPLLLDDCVIAEKYHEKSTVRVCPGYIFEPDAPMEFNGKIIKWQDKSVSYSIHHMTNGWLSRHSKLVSAFFGFFIETYWALGGFLPLPKSRLSKINISQKSRVKTSTQEKKEIYS
ncbi:glycosyltransferase [Aetokthonos hydrillicola Thurmond2011]|jgi:mannosyltransferase OCH1-like enzyme|uniref:Glycosyltransferase n=1 Tax=Aetokthonos hydrillicola Thurmond2011 TaxID=2712845 RepID=A0AAP5IBE7_9CYAN|nr:glycosyltransferase [Aetokthonos hydrillicola]MBO3458683.1 glycosyltransferase [Aetokthonos hydrillicola CCALA 1050]MBW4588036.1 glycosyltransferase [Aetokthonos hydrillicola CCALA 1050]MDR9897012.1 glycosyltransferase [Aetokthonos hydrillicola Thurmond2011]